MSDTKQLFVRLSSLTTGEIFAPAELRERIVADAVGLDSNMNDVVTDILAKRYGVPFVPKHRKAHPSARADILPLRVPADVLAAVDVACAGTGRNRQDETLAALCDHYGLAPVEARKRNGPQRLRTAA